MTPHRKIFIALLSFSTVLLCGCSSANSDGDNGSETRASFAIQGLSEAHTVEACTQLTLNAVPVSSDPSSEFVWNVSAPADASYVFTPNGNQLQFSARSPGEYSISASLCKSTDTANVDCAAQEFSVTVELGTDSNGNGIGDACEASTCIPACDRQNCGVDPICHVSCGSCTDGQTCDDSVGQCVTACTPACEGRTCGSDPICHTSCGTCEDGTACNADGKCDAIQKPGRIVTILMSLTDSRLGYTDPLFHQRARLIEQSVRWVSAVAKPKVLVVQDDTNGGFVWDAQMVRTSLLSRGIQSSFVQEPSEGLRADQLSTIDVVWFTNPAHPVDDALSVATLKSFVQHGGGLVLQGDDITQGPDMSSLTRLQYVSDGEYYCGQHMSRDRGASYSVKIENFAHPVTAGIAGNVYYYGDDIDTSNVIVDPQAKVLAWASAKTCRSAHAGAPTCAKQPVIVAYDMGK